MKASRCTCNSINVTQYTSAQSFLFLSKATCFDKRKKGKNAWYPWEILHLQSDQKRLSDKRQTYLTEQSDIRNNSETVFSKSAAPIKSSRDANTRHPQRQYTRAVTQEPAQWSQHGGQKQYRTKYRTVSTSSRRCTHPRCRTSPTIRNEKTTGNTTKYVWVFLII